MYVGTYSSCSKEKWQCLTTTKRKREKLQKNLVKDNQFGLKYILYNEENALYCLQWKEMIHLADPIQQAHEVCDDDDQFCKTLNSPYHQIQLPPLYGSCLPMPQLLTSYFRMIAFFMTFVYGSSYDAISVPLSACWWEQVSQTRNIDIRLFMDGCLSLLDFYYIKKLPFIISLLQ